jgi:hypothetical protein
VPIGGVDDRVDRFREEIAPHHLEQAPRRYFFLREDLRLRPFLRGTLAPARRASDKPMAIACLRLFTFFPERPLRSVPRFRSCIARFTFCRDFLPYLAMGSSCEPRYSTFAFARSDFTSSSMRCWVICWLTRARTSFRAGNFTGRTSSSMMMW